MLNIKREYFSLEVDRYQYYTSLTDKSKCEVYGKKKFLTDAGKEEYSAHVFKISKDYWTIDTNQLDFTNYPGGIWNDYVSVDIVKFEDYAAPGINFYNMGDITPDNLQEMKNHIVNHLSDLEKRIVEDYLFIDEGTPENIGLPNLPENHFWVRKNGVIVGVNIDYLKDDYIYLKGKLEQDFKYLYNTFFEKIEKELKKVYEDFFEDIKVNLEEEIKKITSEGDKQLEKIIEESEKQIDILKSLGEGIPKKIEELENGKFDKGTIRDQELPTGFKTAIEMSERIIEIPDKLLVEDDEELTEAVFNDQYKQSEIYDVFVEEKECFNISQMDKINEIIEKEKTDIIPDERVLSDVRKLPQENLNIVYANQEYLIDKKIKTYKNLYNIKNVYRLEYSCIIRTFEDELYSFGYNGRGGLGIGNVDNTAEIQKTVHKIIMPDTKAKIKEIFTAHTGGNFFVLYDNNELYAFGSNLNGSLGMGHTNVVSSLTKIPIHFTSPIKMVSSSGYRGYTHSTILLLENGEVYVCGYNGNGQLGLGNDIEQHSFKKITTEFDGKPMIVVAQSIYNHTNTFIVTDKNNVYTSGYNGYYIIGTGNNTDVSIHTLNTELKKVLLEDENIIKIYSLVSAVFVVTNKNVYVYGYNNYNPIYPTDSPIKVPTKINIPKKSLDIVDIQMDNYIYSVDRSTYNAGTSFILFKDGSVYESGHRSFKINPDLSNTKYFTKIAFPYKVSQISCGIEGINFLTQEGRLFYAGENGYYQSGIIQVSTTELNKIAEVQIGYLFNNNYSENLCIKNMQKDDSRLIEVVEQCI